MPSCHEWPRHCPLLLLTHPCLPFSFPGVSWGGPQWPPWQKIQASLQKAVLCLRLTEESTTVSFINHFVGQQHFCSPWSRSDLSPAMWVAWCTQCRTGGSQNWSQMGNLVPNSIGHLTLTLLLTVPKASGSWFCPLSRPMSSPKHPHRNTQQALSWWETPALAD